MKFQIVFYIAKCLFDGIKIWAVCGATMPTSLSIIRLVHNDEQLNCSLLKMNFFSTCFHWVAAGLVLCRATDFSFMYKWLNLLWFKSKIMHEWHWRHAVLLFKENDCTAIVEFPIAHIIWPSNAKLTTMSIILASVPTSLSTSVPHIRQSIMLGQAETEKRKPYSAQ